MSAPPSVRPGNRRVLPAALLAASVVLLGCPDAVRPDGALPAQRAHVMDDAAMRAELSARYGARPAEPAQASRVAVAATILVGPASSLRFDADGSLATVIDTVRITTGQAVLWQWISGLHTVTSGTGSADPNAGVLFDAPSQSTSPQFTFTFANPGTVPFFCRLHEDFNMKGVVVVTAAAAVPAPGEPRLGFAAAPWPNPTRGTVSVRFGLARAGPARLDVVDARGRRIVTPLDGWLDAGPYAQDWDGRTADGARAAPGVYYLRLRLPGYEATRAVVLAR